MRWPWSNVVEVPRPELPIGDPELPIGGPKLPIWSCRVLVGLLLIVLLFSMNRVGRDLWHVLRSRAWPSVNGKVLSFAAPEPRPASSFPADKVISYRYWVDGREYEGWRVSFSRRQRWYQNDVRALIARYDTRQEVRVYHDPSNPADSVLEPGGSNFANGLMLTLQATVAAFLSWWTLFYRPPSPAV